MFKLFNESKQKIVVLTNFQSVYANNLNLHREIVGLMRFCRYGFSKYFNSHLQIYRKRSSTILFQLWNFSAQHKLARRSEMCKLFLILQMVFK